ncbi:MAG: hypothetical protein ACFFKA_15145, partial [Candidatus Thorarchaeota archaeon]
YSSIAHVSDWLSVLDGARERIPILLIGGKQDLDIIREISYEDGKHIAKKMGLDGFMECSSKTGENVEKSFKSLTRMMLSRMQ